MKEVKVKDLVDLAVSDVDSCDLKIQKIYEWYFERIKTSAQWILGAAASLFVALVAAFIKGDLSYGSKKSYAIISLILLAGGIGIVQMHSLRNIHKQFIGALKLHSELKKVKPFLMLYRQRRGRVQSE